jgi:hypothetical protein
MTCLDLPTNSNLNLNSIFLIYLNFGDHHGAKLYALLIDFTLVIERRWKCRMVGCQEESQAHYLQP